MAALAADAVNPFTRNAGSRIFDANCTPVIPYHSVRQIVITSDANGHGAVVIAPTWAEQLYLAPTISVANDMTALGAATAGSGYSATAFESYRIASFGVKVKGIVAPLNASGYVRATTDITTVAHDLTAPQNHLACKTVPLSGCNFGVLSKPTGIEAYETIPIATGSDDYHGWTSITISLDGVPASTACLYVEVCINYEIFPAAGAGQNQFAQKAAPSHHGLSGAIDNLRNGVGEFVEGGLEGLGVQQAAGWLYGKARGALGAAEGAVESVAPEWAVPVIEAAPELAATAVKVGIP